MGECEVVETLVVSAKNTEQHANERIRLRSILAQLWGLRRDSNTDETDESMTSTGESGLKGKSAKLLGTFREIRGFLPSLANHASEATLGLLIKLRGNKSTESPPPAK